jgi:hypothetical protein
MAAHFVAEEPIAFDAKKLIGCDVCCISDLSINKSEKRRSANGPDRSPESLRREDPLQEAQSVTHRA